MVTNGRIRVDKPILYIFQCLQAAPQVINTIEKGADVNKTCVLVKLCNGTTAGKYNNLFSVIDFYNFVHTISYKIMLNDLCTSVYK